MHKPTHEQYPLFIELPQQGTIKTSPKRRSSVATTKTHPIKLRFFGDKKGQKKFLFIDLFLRTSCPKRRNKETRFNSEAKNHYLPFQFEAPSKKKKLFRLLTTALLLISCVSQTTFHCNKSMIKPQSDSGMLAGPERRRVLLISIDLSRF